LQQLIEAKMKGVTIEPRAVSTPSPVIDLMAAPKRSLAQEPSGPEQHPRRSAQGAVTGMTLDGHSRCALRRNGGAPPPASWTGARPDTIEHIVIEFDRPQTISRLVYEVEETMRERTQEVRVEVSDDGGRSYRQILVQEYNFSPGGATLPAPKNSASISARLAISVSALFPTRTAPAQRR
jgi:hypothetical protein